MTAEQRLWRNKGVVAAELERRGGHCVWPGCESGTVQWHHRDPESKSTNVARMIHTASVKRLMDELAKCDPYCRFHHGATERRRKHEAGEYHGTAYCHEKFRCQRPDCVEAARAKWNRSAEARRDRQASSQRDLSPH
jgi:hypothetical protein